LNKYEEGDNKKGSFKQYGCIGFGIDESLVLFIDVAANDLQGRHLFLFKNDGRFDFSNTTLAEKDSLIANIEFLIESLQTTTNIAERVSSFKRTSGGSGGGGGGRGGSFGGARPSGGGYGGGNYQRQAPQQSTFGDSPDVENELHV
jgi:hypothetical protein